MNVLIMSRDEIEEVSKKPFSSRATLISITDADWTFAELVNKPQYILQLVFDDVDNDIFEDELGRAQLHKNELLLKKSIICSPMHRRKKLQSSIKPARMISTF